MTTLVQNVTLVLSFATILACIYIVVLIVELLVGKKRGLSLFTAEYVLELGLIASGAAFLLSLFYSSVAGFEPCTLCWWQRIFIYPQVIIFAVALYYRRTRGLSDKLATTTSLVLSIMGGAIALYQYYAQMFNPSILSACAASSASCAKLFFVSFGFITIPFMSFVGFAFLIVIIIAHKLIIRAPHV